MAGNATGYVGKAGGQLIKAAAYTAVTDVTGAAIDTQGFTHLTALFSLGTVTGVGSSTLTLKVQESDSSGSGYADITGATSGALTTADTTYSDAIAAIVVNLVSGSRKRYMRLVATPSNHAVNVPTVGLGVLTEGDASVPTAAKYLRVSV
jgi:hypothetical protein